MDRVDTIVYGVSALLQLAAIIFALRVSREVRDRRPWYVMMAALFVMLAARLLALKVPVQNREHLNPFIATAISTLLLAAMFAVRRVARAERQSRQAALQNAA